MEEHAPPEACHLIPMSSNAQVNNVLTKIDTKVKKLKTDGITLGDQEILRKDRLNLVWGEPSEVPESQGGQATKWRRGRARRAYTEIHKASEHLFLAVILAIPPTECAKTSFDNVLEHLLRIENYEPYRLNLSPATKRFFETIAAEHGFSGASSYLSFMQALFPQSEEPRQIQFAYSSIPLDNIEKLFEIMRKGIETSQQWTSERERGERASSFVTALIPTGEKDCCFTVNIGREDMMRGLRPLGLTQLKL
ncbi:hypothetical protein K469DRAFT_622026 [Zopfia rhizophila CBS 207.26]|uniref:Uncharacterized protein n=1 Tax=Zopfia rhizophila CBS 207.26 TaxID=1314779 RepID=A0A6A6EQ58_9PEZI|nr:hypothetical protein K469DRAFT_622026 [Zopfia rhizophila CBS 207.26]